MWDDNEEHQKSADMADMLLNLEGVANGSVLDVGCGRGWVVKHLRKKGRIAQGCEFSGYARTGSVCKARLADLHRTLPYNNRSFDLVICTGVLDYILPGSLCHAVEELYRVSANYLWTSILVYCPEEVDQVVMPADLWVPIFEEAGWVPIEIEGLFETYGFNDSIYEWHQLWERPNLVDLRVTLTITDYTDAKTEFLARKRKLLNRVERWIHYSRLKRLKRDKFVPKEDWDG